MPRREIRDWCQEVEMDELSSTGERVYVRLRMAADSAGRFYGDAEWVLSRCFSCRVGLSVDEVEGALCELERAGMVVRYEAEGGRYLAICDWGVRQRSEPRFPAPVFAPVAGDGGVIPGGCQSTVRQVSVNRQTDVRQVSDSCQSGDGHSPLSPSFPPAPPLSTPTPPDTQTREGARACEGGLGGGLEVFEAGGVESSTSQVPDSGESGGDLEGRKVVVDGLLRGVNVFRASELPFKEELPLSDAQRGELGAVVPGRPVRCATGSAFDVPGCADEVLAVMRSCLHYSERDEELVKQAAEDFYEHYKDGRTAGGGLLKNWRYKAQCWLRDRAEKAVRARLREEARAGRGAPGRGFGENIKVDVEGF